mgnify:FL=1
MKDKIINKTGKEKLTYSEIEYMVMGYVNGKINDKDMSKFILNIYNNGISEEETYYLTDVMIKSGKVNDMSFLDKKIVDKHSTGGVGDKVSIIVAPIVASLGVAVPKMSGRGLGLTGGTADKLESIRGYKLNISDEESKNILSKVGCYVISQSDDMCIADKKIYALRNEIGATNSIPLIASSIMSKKIACGADSIVIDLKVGSGAFMKNRKDAIKLSKLMKNIAKRYNKKLICVLSDMENPLGKYVGNKLEVLEAIKFFDGIYDKRLYELCVYIASTMVSVSLNKTFKKAKEMVILSIKSGMARAKFYEWIKAQHGTLNGFEIKANKYIVSSDKEGYLNKIDAEEIAKLVFDLGAGRSKKEDNIDYNVGVYINENLGKKIRCNDILGIIYYNKNIDDMENRFKNAFIINNKKKRVHNIVIKSI